MEYRAGDEMTPFPVKCPEGAPSPARHRPAQLYRRQTINTSIHSCSLGRRYLHLASPLCCRQHALAAFINCVAARLLPDCCLTLLLPCATPTQTRARPRSSADRRSGTDLPTSCEKHPVACCLSRCAVHQPSGSHCQAAGSYRIPLWFIRARAMAWCAERRLTIAWRVILSGRTPRI